PKEHSLATLVPNWVNESLDTTQEVSGEVITLLYIAGKKAASVKTKLSKSYPGEVGVLSSKNEIDFYQEVFRLLQPLMRNKVKTNFTLLIEEADRVRYDFVSGLLQTVALENPLLSCKIVVVESFFKKDSIQDIMISELGDKTPYVRYVSGTREVLRFSEINIEENIDSDAVLLVSGGVYLITGGSGGLGQQLISFLQQTPDMQIIITGRSASSSVDIPNVVYKQCDVSNRKSVIDLISWIKSAYGQLNGVFHLAGSHSDGYILDKDIKDSLAVLTPKISGVQNLDEAIGNAALDFMIYFSSIAGAFGNIGQSDYAAANAYMDSYVYYRNELVRTGNRNGITKSINWPLWENGGMQLDEGTLGLFAAKGIYPLPTQEGLTALQRLMKSAQEQVVVYYGDKHRIVSDIIVKQA
ncbi:SDR family NAD(P)-dependent oxidoreductase, partial [Aquimarina aggregata]|uniref:SDR family NAD(P)-dependent oxidoreductase n=1 Tax=Aquimarina aggregata TaxID=1642818 RepID=UPI00249116C3